MKQSNHIYDATSQYTFSRLLSQMSNDPFFIRCRNPEFQRVYVNWFFRRVSVSCLLLLDSHANFAWLCNRGSCDTNNVAIAIIKGVYRQIMLIDPPCAGRLELTMFSLACLENALFDLR